MVNSDENIKDILQLTNIPVVRDRNYWLIRTESGLYYLDFLLNGYVAIGWDNINIATIQKENYSKIKGIVKENYPKDNTPGRTANKLISFVNEIHEGDVVIIPSQNSEKASIGILLKKMYYEDPMYIENQLKENTDSEIIPCPYHKRRRVKWLKSISKEGMDVYLSKLFNAHQAIYSANDYAQYINRNIYDMYISGDELHSVLHAGHPNGFSLKSLTDFVEFFNTAIDFIQETSDIVIDKEKIDMKINIHSPGLIEIISAGAFAALGISVLILSLNNVLAGGKFKFNFKNPLTGNELSAETESTGVLGKFNERRLNDQQHHLEEQKIRMQFLQLQQSLQLKIPDTENADEKSPENDIDKA